ncbi:hypothetical protein OM318_02560 [Escherichia albertii]|uniref:Uncharacterized protein n=1 Tax=Escherichia coli TaxID=562 RepID=A0A789M797_ECOLX|nr:hypothetical protein [Escherichia albertii]EEW0763831.1 hypothetical protein [Escherichia albertii]EEW4358161.1 hypothetical protein [Escherichia albertii]EEW7551921.1 hypothetical protein [Escherichia albertii]EEX4923080.1 hypothetical protein [Escherichia albertii]EFF0800838.1 hypothetical protein [Escherichia albertii]
MSQYARAALIAYNLVADKSMSPREAWDAAVAKVTKSESSRKKGCPRATFLALADCGYLKNVEPQYGEKKGGKLYQRAVEVANLILDLPGISKAELVDKTCYKDRQGSYDIVLTLAQCGFLQCPQQDIK